PAGRLPRVVRRAGPEGQLVFRDPRVSSDFLCASRVPQEIRVVGLLPDENQMRGSHEICNERAATRGTGEGIGADTEPAAVVGAVVLRPELFVGEELLVEKAGLSRLKAAVLHAKQASRSHRNHVTPCSLGKRGPGVRAN